MSTRKTTVVVEAQAKGFDRTKRQVKDTFDSFKGAKEANRSMAMMLKNSVKMAEALKGVSAGMRGVQQSMRQMSREMERAIQQQQKMLAQSRQSGGGGSGLRSALLGGVAGGAVGYALGGMRRGGAIASAGLSGGSAVAAGLGGIPFVGGALQGQFNAMMGAASAGVQSSRERQSLLPYLDVTGLRGRLSRSRASAIADNPIPRMNYKKIAAVGLASGRVADTSVAPSLVDPDAGGFVDQMRQMFLGSGPGKGSPEYRAAVSAAERQIVSVTANTSAARERDRQVSKIKAAKVKQVSAVNAGEDRIMSNILRPFEEAGTDYAAGGATGGRQFASTLASSSGLSLQSFLGRNGGLGALARNSMGASTLYGVDTSVAGAFAKGSAQGVYGGDANGAFVSSLAKAVQLGLTGSDVVKYMQETAGALTAWETSGLALDPNSINGLSKSLAFAGLGGLRGSRVGRALQATSGKMAQNGPTSGFEAMAFRDLYGYSGGSQEDYFRAQLAAEKGNVQEGGIEKLIRSMSGNAKTPEAAASMLMSGFGSLGASIGPQEALSLAQGRDPAALRGLRKRLRQSSRRRAGDPSGDALDLVSSMAREQDRMASEQQAIGRGTAGVAQAIERGQIANLNKFAESAPTFLKLVEGLNTFSLDATTKITSLIKQADEFMTRLNQRVP